MENIVVAKMLGGPDEYKFMYNDLPLDKICPLCHSWLGFREINPNFKPSKKKSCLRCTYDGFMFVSEVFRQFCIDNQYPHLEFIPYPKAPGYYYLYPKMVYPLDPIRRKVKFINKCSLCGNYEGIIGSAPSYTQTGFNLPSNDFIYRTNLEFGTKEMKKFNYIIGLETAKKMKAAKLPGLLFYDVYK